MTERIEKVENIVFDGDTIQAVKRNETIYVPLKPICAAMGLDWGGQFKLINRDEVMSSVVVMMTITAADGKNYDTMCLPLDYLNGWLFKLTPSLFASKEVREKVIRYQRECFRVLAEHFLGKASAEAAVSAAVIERIRAAELVDRRNILKQLGGIMSGYGLSAAAVSRLAREAENVVRSDWWHPGLPSESWAEAGSEGEPELLRRSTSRLS